jgi:hypothetical protein
MAGVAARRTYRLIRLAPILLFFLRERPITLEGGAELDRRYLGACIRYVWTALVLAGGTSGQQQCRHDKNLSHSSLDIDMARNNAREQRRPPRARAGSVRRQRARGGRSRPSGWTPGGGNCEKTYFAFDGEETIKTPAGPAIEADAQQAVHGPQWALFASSSPCAFSPACE